VRGVVLAPTEIEAEVEGVHVLEDRIPVLRQVNIAYRLRIPAGSRETVDRALSRHVEKCPTARTLAPAVSVHWSADIQERSPA